MRRAPSLLALVALLLMPLGRARAGDPPPPGFKPQAVRVFVDSPGFYRVKSAALRALGLSDDQHLEAWSGWKQLLVHTSRVGDDPVFLVHPTFRFHPRPASVTLRVGRPVQVAPPRPPTGPSGGPGPDTWPRLTRFSAEPHAFGALAAAELEVYAPDPEFGAVIPTWFLGHIPRGGTFEIPPEAAALPGSTQELGLVVRLTQPGQAQILATQAGEAIGTSETESHSSGVSQIKWTVGALDPSKAITLRDVTPAVPAPDRDVSDDRGSIWIETMAWTGAMRALPERGVVSWRPRPDGNDRTFRVRPSSGRVLAVGMETTTEHAVPVLVGLHEKEGHVEVSLTGEFHTSEVFLSTELRELQPVVAPPRQQSLPPLVTQARGAQHVIVSTHACLKGAQRLAEHRTRTGLQSLVLAASDIYEAFADGEQDPQAIRAFLRMLREVSAGKTPKYVLLCGDAVRDRADKADFETIPALMARTQYNGATPADSLYVEADDSHGVGAPFVGRLPFRDAATMEQFVDRLIAYETHPPVDRTRRLIRFLANEARFGPQVDAQIELFFKLIVTKAIPAEYDVEVTFASPTSTFLWPPREFNAKVLDSLNEGALFYTYVGHGFDQGFDSLHVGNERYPVLHLKDVPRVAVTGTPPVMFSIACTTAQFDHPDRVGLGEALLAQPRGPIAFLGATRLCHPAGNVFLGRALAYAMFQDAAPGRRLGDVLANARDLVLDPRRDTTGEVNLLTMAARSMLPQGTGVTLERLQREAFWLDNLLGDPGTRLPFPEPLAGLEARWDAGAIDAEASGLPEGARVTFTVEMPRARPNPLRPIQKGLQATKPADAEAIRSNHRNANDKVVVSTDVTAVGGRARARLTAPEALPLTDPVFRPALVVKAWVQAGERVLLGARTVTIPAPAEPAGDAPR
jgi:hypothetical protein